MQAKPQEVSADKANTPTNNERAAFEAFVLSQWAGAVFHRRDALSRHDPRHGQYVHDAIQNAWVGWQGRARHATVGMPADISHDLLGTIVDEVFDGAIEDASVIEDIYRVIARRTGGAV